MVDELTQESFQTGKAIVTVSVDLITAIADACKRSEPYTDPVKWNNIPLTATEWLRMTRPEHPKYDRNKNILIVGGSGAGKTRGFVKPSLMQMQCSYVVTDPNGYTISR